MFKSHERSEDHRDNVKFLNDEETTNDIAYKFSDIHIKKSSNRQIFFQVLQCIQFLTHQGLAFRNDNGDVNFDQLLKRCKN